MVTLVFRRWCEYFYLVNLNRDKFDEIRQVVRTLKITGYCHINYIYVVYITLYIMCSVK